MSSIHQIPFDNQTGRVETGPVQFGNDWPGLFIRGDNFAYYKMAWESLLSYLEDSKGINLEEECPFAFSIIRGLFDEPVII